MLHSTCPFSFEHYLLQDLNKRLSLPADIRIPDGYLEKLQINSPPFDQPMSRRSRRASLVSVMHLPFQPTSQVFRIHLTHRPVFLSCISASFPLGLLIPEHQHVLVKIQLRTSDLVSFFLC